jgi:hypothetical protein
VNSCHVSLCTKEESGYRIEIRDVAFRFEDWFEWWGNLLLEERVPFYSIKERMRFQFSCIFLCTKSVFWIPIEKLTSAEIKKSMYPFDERLSFRGKSILWESNFSERDIFVHLLSIIGIKRRPSTTHLKHQHSQRPEINKFRVSFC